MPLPSGSFIVEMKQTGVSNGSLDSTFGQITNLTSQISNRQGQATFRIDF